MSILDDTLRLCRIDSVSGNESDLAQLILDELKSQTHLDVERIGDNVVAATRGHHAARLIVAGHIDTVPGDVSTVKIVDDRVIGLGACDMKGSVAVMLREAQRNVARPFELTWVFYAREEIARSQSGLLELAELRPDLLAADCAILAEPTGGAVEAGCQGTLRIDIVLKGERAHTARPFMGRNAIHRMGELIGRVAQYHSREVSIDGVTYVEQLQVVFVEGGIANNVVPDVARCTLNHRVAPDRGRDEAVSSVTQLIGDLLGADDELIVVDFAPPARPSLDDSIISGLVRATGVAPRAKVGWTDVATFAERGIPAANFGAGDPQLAHRADEFVTLAELESFSAALSNALTMSG